MKTFTFAPMPYIYFGAGSIKKVGELTAWFGSNVLFVTGGSSLMRSGRMDEIASILDGSGVRYGHVTVKGEPSPALVDKTVEKFKNIGIDAVLAVGGGSAVDFGKVLSAMLVTARDEDISVEEFLEGVGGRRHDGRKLPFIAVSTTSGTGSEATKNAVLSRVGEGGFKKSIRHDNFVPNVAIVDPELVVSCPADVSAACGMDAFTQLLESYVSTKSNPMTDILAVSGLREVGKSLVSACMTSPEDIEVRSSMAYAALMSGITLANAGLGLVHGLASTIGGHFDIPHGAVCANIMGPAMRMTVEALREKAEGGDGRVVGVLRKFAHVGAIFDGREHVEDADIYRYTDLLIERIYEWTELLEIPCFGEFGMTENDIEAIVSMADNKNNPVTISKENVGQILRERL